MKRLLMLRIQRPEKAADYELRLKIKKPKHKSKTTVWKIKLRAKFWTESSDQLETCLASSIDLDSNEANGSHQSKIKLRWFERKKTDITDVKAICNSPSVN